MENKNGDMQEIRKFTEAVNLQKTCLRRVHLVI